MDRFSADGLRSRMAAFHLQTQQAIYLLIDSSAHEQLPQAVFERVQDHSYQVLPREWDASQLSDLPLLVEVSGSAPDRDALLDWLINQGLKADAFMAMASPFDLEAVTEHWRHMLHAQLADGEILHFRIFDTRVARRFFEAGNSRDNAKLLGPLSRLWLLGSTQDCLEIMNSQPGTIDWARVEYPWIRPTPEQLAALNDNMITSLFGGLRRFLWQHHPDRLGQYPVAWTDRMLELGIQRAQQLGFTSEFAAGQFILLCLTFGFAWLDADPVKSALARQNDRDQCITDLLEKTPEQTWRNIELIAKPQQDWARALQESVAKKSLTQGSPRHG